MEGGAVMRDIMTVAVVLLGFGICGVFVDRGIDVIVKAKFHQLWD